MRGLKRARLGFSLIEVSAALAIISVAMLGLIALVPVGLSNTLSTVHQTRAAELARTVFTTISSESFTASYCFSQNGDTLDFSTLNQSSTGSPATVLFACYDPRRFPAGDSPSDALPLIMRADQLPPEMNADFELYRIELRNEPQTYVGAAGVTSGKVIGSLMRMSVFPVGAKQTALYVGSSFLANIKKANVFAQTAP